MRNMFTLCTAGLAFSLSACAQEPAPVVDNGRHFYGSDAAHYYMAGRMANPAPQVREPMPAYGGAPVVEYEPAPYTYTPPSQSPVFASRDLAPPLPDYDHIRPAAGPADAPAYGNFVPPPAPSVPAQGTLYSQTSYPSYVPPPPALPAVQPLTPPAPAPVPAGSVMVRDGDTLFSIGKRHGVYWQDIAAVNGVTPQTLRAGQILRIPAASQTAAPMPAYGTPASNAFAAAAPAYNDPYRMPPPSAGYVPAPAASAALPPAPVTPPILRAQPDRTLLPTTYQVKRGDTLFSIGKYFGVPWQEISTVNRLTPGGLRAGQTLHIPESTAGLFPAAGTPVPAAGPAPQAAVYNPATPDFSKPRTRFIWPVKGKVIMPYGSQSNGAFNDGINIAVPAGTPVRAAAGGDVIYSGSELQGYGNLLIVRHKDGWVTAYAHNNKLLVKTGDYVGQGDVIAYAGQTGTVDRPQLHFSVRKGRSPHNPMEFL